MKNYEHIFKPLKLRGLTVKNRIEVSPAEPFLCTKDGLITPEFIEFTAAMAKGGAGIVTIGDSPINKEYAAENHYVVNLSDPFVVHGLVQCVEQIHRYGAIASIELNLRDHRLPHEYTTEGIKQIIQDFVDSAIRCKLAGFDMIMVHGGHGHSVASFFSPELNKRTDEYGAQNLENRCRFAIELLDRIREAIGNDMVIEYRMSGDELNPEGVHLEEAIEFAKIIQKKVDLIHVSAGNLYDVSTIAYQIQPTYIKRATNVHLAEAIKKAVDIPVTTVGSFNIDLAEDALAQGKADMVAMIRSFVADPDMVNKAKKGKADEIRPCIRCCICTGDDPHGCPKPLRCSVNAIAGRNLEFKDIKEAKNPKKVMIIGGGAGGMEAARRLVERGHKPIIVEKEDHLGGTLIDASACSLKADVKKYLEWSVHMTEKTDGIDIRLNTTATAEYVKKENPDALIIAVGAEPVWPHISGFDRKNVVLATHVDRGLKEVGHSVVLIGAGLTGTETAVSLAQKGHDVTMVDMLSLSEIDAKKQASQLVTSTLRGMQMSSGVKVIEHVKVMSVDDKGVNLEMPDKKPVHIPCDSVVLSMGVKPRQAIVEELSGIIEDTVIIGDCNGTAGNITSAVREGFFAAMDI